MKETILLYTPSLSPRLEYCCDHIFNNVLGLKTVITSSLQDFKMFSGPKINYSKDDIASSLKIIPSGLLTEKNIKKQLTEIVYRESVPVFFVTNQGGEINFDIFSAVFYMLSRYEEYLPFKPDKFNRFPGSESLAFKNGFLEIPVVDLWIKSLGTLLEQKFPGLLIAKSKFNWLSSIDVDVPWAFLHRNSIHTLLALVKSFITGKDFQTRIKVLKNQEKDPYFTFDFLSMIHANEVENLIFFFLSGRPGGIDTNINPGNPAWQTLVRDISSRFPAGIHPSRKAYNNKKILNEEIKTFSLLLNRPVNHSRQHYLLLSFPSTYRNLVEAGIRNDYTLGFADHCGFRAGTSHSFFFYDLKKEEKTGLRLWPLAVMDRTLKKYMKLGPEESGRKINELIDKVYSAGGTFMSLWHNDAVGNFGEWEGWRNIYTNMISYLKSKKT